jgi:hypothetical protein
VEAAGTNGGNGGDGGGKGGGGALKEEMQYLTASRFEMLQSSDRDSERFHNSSRRAPYRLPPRTVRAPGPVSDPPARPLVAPAHNEK